MILTLSSNFTKLIRPRNLLHNENIRQNYSLSLCIEPFHESRHVIIMSNQIFVIIKPHQSGMNHIHVYSIPQCNRNSKVFKQKIISQQAICLKGFKFLERQIKQTFLNPTGITQDRSQKQNCRISIARIFFCKHSQPYRIASFSMI